MLPRGIVRGIGRVGREGRVTWTSRPAVKARSPAPVRTTERMLGSWERELKILARLSHILEVC
jgi:hypothetical protein